MKSAATRDKPFGRRNAATAEMAEMMRSFGGFDFGRGGVVTVGNTLAIVLQDDICMYQRRLLRPASLGFALTLPLFVFPGWTAIAAQTSPSSTAPADKAACDNGSCNANCVKYLHQGDRLTVLVLDEDGNIFESRTIPLSRAFELSSREPPHPDNTLTLGNGDKIGTLSSASTYTHTTDGTMQIAVVSVVRLFRNKDLMEAYIYDHKFPYKINDTKTK